MGLSLETLLFTHLPEFPLSSKINKLIALKLFYLKFLRSGPAEWTQSSDLF